MKQLFLVLCLSTVWRAMALTTWYPGNTAEPRPDWLNEEGGPVSVRGAPLHRVCTSLREIGSYQGHRTVPLPAARPTLWRW